MSRSVQDPADLARRVKQLEERLRALETSRRAANTSIGGGGIFLLRNGTFMLTEASGTVDPGTKGRIYMNTTTEGSDEGYQLVVERAPGVEGVFSNGVALEVRTVDGSVNDTANGPTVRLRDKQGGIILSDANGSVPGMGDPKLPVNWHDPTAVKTTTSASFSTVGALTWYKYHSHLRIEVLVSNGAATVCEVRVRDTATNEYYREQFAGSFNEYVNIDLARSLFEVAATNTNGDSQFLVVEHRRVSGASTAGTLITDAMGIDLS